MTPTPSVPALAAAPGTALAGPRPARTPVPAGCRRAGAVHPQRWHSAQRVALQPQPRASSATGVCPGCSAPCEGHSAWHWPMRRKTDPERASTVCWRTEKPGEWGPRQEGERESGERAVLTCVFPSGSLAHVTERSSLGQQMHVVVTTCGAGDGSPEGQSDRDGSHSTWEQEKGARLAL